MVKVLNRVLRKAQMQELYPDEAEVLVLHFMERYPKLEQELILSCREEFRHMPSNLLKRLLLVSTIMIEELMDLLFVMRGVESIYCIKERNYHEYGM
jgi:hypothetical protein